MGLAGFNNKPANYHHLTLSILQLERSSHHNICIFSAEYCQLSAPVNSLCEIFELCACSRYFACTQPIILIYVQGVQ